MGKASPIIESFNGGELSPLMEGRVGFEKYGSGCAIMENFIPTAQGPARVRPGTQYLGLGRNAGDIGVAPVCLLSFVANTGAAFILELGSGYMRFWKDRQRIKVYSGVTWAPGVDGDLGVIAEIGTPWNAAALVGDNGECLVQVAQSNDVMWLVCGNAFPQKLSRIDVYQFTMAAMGDGTNPISPFKDQNILTGVTLYTSSVTGPSISVTCTGAIFTAADVGRPFYIEQPAADSIKPWQVAVAKVLNDTVRSDGNNYQALNAATTGNVKPTHTTGAKFDGASGVQWNWTDQGYGVVQIKTVAADGKSATGDVLIQLPATVAAVAGVAPAVQTHRWAHAAWNDADGYPTAVHFFRGRLAFGRGQTVWMSVAGDFENFATSDGGVVTADSAIIATIAADKNDRILWFCNIGPLLAGSPSTEYAISELSQSEPLGPANIQIQPQSGYGSRQIQPIRVNEAVLFIQRAGQRLRECLFSWQSQGFVSADLSVLAQHIARGDRSVTGRDGINGMTWQREPDAILWCTRGDGYLACFTYQKDHNVSAWHRQKLGGRYQGTTGATLDYGIVISSASVPSPDGTMDDVYLAVSRTIGGVPTTFIEVLGNHLSTLSTNVSYYHEVPATKESMYLDACITGTGDGSGLIHVPHLAGETVTAVCNGMLVPPQVATAGAISVPTGHASDRYVVGLPYRATVKTMRVNAGAQDGTSQGKLSKLQSVTIRVKDSLNFLYGPDENNLTREEFRKTGTPLDQPTPLFTGDRTLTWGGDWEDGSRVCIVQDQPFPLTICALMPRAHVEDER